MDFQFKLFVCLVFILDTTVVIKGSRMFDMGGEDLVLALEKENIMIQCRSNMSMAYCNFVHPSGKRFSYSGNELKDGKCLKKIQVAKQDGGEWKCHIGNKMVGVEATRRIQVRVARELAALRKNVSATHGKEVTLTCVTTKSQTPLSYCRFEPPFESPFSISEEVKPNNPILGKYFFPANRSLDRGDCAVVIKQVKYQDIGRWTCGAGMEDGKEYTDTIDVTVEGLYTLSTANVTGLTFGALIIVACLAGLGAVVWKKRHMLGSRGNPVADLHELGPLPRHPRASLRSQISRSVPNIVIQSPHETGPSAVPLVS